MQLYEKLIQENALVELDNVVKNYKTGAGVTTVLKGINLQVGRGEFVGVIGKSGSGKSTLINMITGIDRPSSGEVYISGNPIHKMNESQVAKWRGRNLGIVFQFFQLLPTLTVSENIMLPMDFTGIYKGKERRERALNLLSLVGLVDQADKMPSELSGGQQQRVAIARALANDPPLIVADEPTGNLDSKTSENVFLLFENLVKEGKTILMVTHDDDQAKRVGRTIVISDGEIIEEHLAKTFPALTDKELVWATGKMGKKLYEPHEVIIHEGKKHGKLFIVSRGSVEVVIHPKDHDIVVTELVKGQYFGEIELLRKNPSSIASVRAGIGGSEVVTLDRETFSKLVKSSKDLQKEFSDIATKRLRETSSLARKAPVRKA